jgi:CDGSH-type Zn-finger protein
MGDSSAGEPATLITPYQDGPLIIRGDFRIQTWDGMPIPVDRQTVALCRCGRSAIKPFCDGSHARAGFRAPDGARADTMRTARKAKTGPGQAGGDEADPANTDWQEAVQAGRQRLADSA